MISKKTYRKTRWMEHLFEICYPYPDPDLEGWYEIKPEYTVTVRPPDIDCWMQTSFVKMRQFKSEAHPHLACIISGAACRVYPHEKDRVRVVHSPDAQAESYFELNKIHETNKRN